MDDSLAAFKAITYKVVVAGLALTAANEIQRHLNLSLTPLEQKDVTGLFVAPPSELKKPVGPAVNLRTSDLMFVFNDGKLSAVVTKDEMEAPSHYEEWAHMSSLIDSNAAYNLATNWLSGVDVDLSKLNKKYQVHVTQPAFAPGQPNALPNTRLVPIYYVSWDAGDSQGAEIRIFGPAKRFMKLRIEDASLTAHTYLSVTNQKELANMTNMPMRMAATNQNFLRLLCPAPPESSVVR